jgi:CheY-like chemotaxis protein
MTPREPPRGTAGAQVLLVDDDPDQVEMYRYALEDVGFVVVSAGTGHDALTHARTLGPDVIVLDVRLPDMTGWEVCTVLKTDPRTDAIPVIVLTAAASPNLATEATNAGCAACLLKPCYPDQLAVSIRNVLATA